MAGDGAAIFHLVDPITGFSNGRIMGGQEQGFLSLLHNILKQLKGALRVGSVEIAGRFVRQNDSRIIGERAYDSHTLLFASREMTAGPPQFVAQANRFQQAGSAFAHLTTGKLPELAHRNHYVLLCGEILHQKMELENESDQFVPAARKFLIA